jgi:hypothetical protein
MNLMDLNYSTTCEPIFVRPIYNTYSPLCLSFNLLVTRCTNKYNIQQLYVLSTLYLCVL